MAVRPDIWNEIGAAASAEALSRGVATGWAMSVDIVSPGRSPVTGYVVTIKNTHGFTFTFAQRNAELPDDPDEIAIEFLDKPLIEMQALARAGARKS